MACGEAVSRPVVDAGQPPVRASRRLSDELIEDARRVFQRQAGRDVTAEDARQMLENLIGFFTVLNDWDRAQARDTTDRPAPTSDER